VVEGDEGLAAALTPGLPPEIQRQALTDVLEWFGYKLHLLVDIKHEVTLDYRITGANAGDGATLPGLLQQAQAKRCNGKSRYGKTVRVKQELDLRRFPPIPRQTKEFERLYKGRTAVERVNARLKIFWGIDDGNITGAQRFFGFASVVLLVHTAFATLLARAPRWEGTLCQTRLGPIQKALQGTT
jgi:hypothetical protein